MENNDNVQSVPDPAQVHRLLTPKDLGMPESGLSSYWFVEDPDTKELIRLDIGGQEPQRFSSPITTDQVLAALEELDYPHSDIEKQLREVRKSTDVFTDAARRSFDVEVDIVSKLNRK